MFFFLSEFTSAQFLHRHVADSLLGLQLKLRHKGSAYSADGKELLLTFSYLHHFCHFCVKPRV